MAWSNVDSISIPWGNVYGKPNRAGSSSDGGAANSVANSLTISLNGTSQGAYNGSAAKSVNITAASVGAAASSHNHSASNITSGTLSVARGGTGVTSDKAIALKSYPVGAIYLSFVSTSPATLFGGSWSQISNRFIYAGNGTSTGGSLRHKHWIPIGKAVSDGMYVYDFNNNGSMFSGKNISGNRTLQGALMNFNSFDTYSTGPNAGFSAMMLDSTSDPVLNAADGVTSTAGESDLYPPYQMVYCWRRTA